MLHLPRAIGRLVLFSDTSKVGTGSSLWQYQDGKPRLIGYASKNLPEACLCYSVTELEMTGLLVNVGLWKNILKHREFDAAVDHVAVTQILKAKTETASNRIMRLLDRLSAYSFNLYYLKGKDMILADYLSRNSNEDDEDPADLIPVSFCKIRDIEEFCVATRASVKASGEIVPEVHGMDKELDPHITPEQQYIGKVAAATPKGTRPKTIKTPVRDSPNKSRTDIRSEPRVMDKQSEEIARQSPKAYKQEKVLYKSPRVGLVQPRLICVGTPQKGDSNGESVEKSDVDLKFMKRRHNLDIDTDTGEGEEILDPEVKIPEESDFYEPEPLKQVVDVKKQWYKFLRRQGEVDKILAQINHKILRDTKLLLMLKDLKAAYLTSPHFKDVYLHLCNRSDVMGNSPVPHPGPGHPPAV